jgi:hypothetical protein
MRFLLITLLSLSFSAKVFAQYDPNNRSACIDELKSEVDKVCDPKIQESTATVLGMLKNSGFIAETDSRVKRICSYHCPQDIAEKCHALLGKGPSLLSDVLSGKKDMMSAYSEGCRVLSAKIVEAKKEIAAMGGGGDSAASASGKAVGTVDNGYAKGNFRKPASTGKAPAAPAGKCNPYNAAGQEEIGKCPE